MNDAYMYACRSNPIHKLQFSYRQGIVLNDQCSVVYIVCVYNEFITPSVLLAQFRGEQLLLLT